MKELTAVLLLLCGPAAFADGPLFKSSNTFTQQEFDNVYQDLRTRLPLSGGTMMGNIAMSSKTISGASLYNGNSFFAIGNTLPASGTGVDVGFTGVFGFVQTYDVVGNTYKDLGLFTSKLFINNGSGTDMLVAQTTGVTIRGTNTNDSATAGFVGEYVSAVVASVNCAASGQFSDGTSISLTAGDWDVSTIGSFNLNGATSAAGNDYDLGVSATSGNSSVGLANGDTEGWVMLVSATSMSVGTVTIPPKRFSLSATTTLYLKMRCNFSAGTPVLFGARLSARRSR